LILKDTGSAQRIAQEALKINPDYRPAMVIIARDHYRNRRLDLALGYRHTGHLEVKAQYSLSNQAGRDIDGEHLFAAQFVLWL